MYLTIDIRIKSEFRRSSPHFTLAVSCGRKKSTSLFANESVDYANINEELNEKYSYFAILCDVKQSVVFLDIFNFAATMATERLTVVIKLGAGTQ